MEFLSLPKEILCRILTYCDYGDFENISLTCSFLNDLCKDESIWRMKCLLDFRVNMQGLCTSSRLIYTKLLSSYGCMIGTYSFCLTAYGGLIEIKYSDCSLIAWEWKVPANTLADPLVKEVLFKIVMNPNSGTMDFVCGPKKYPHQFSIDVNKRSGRHAFKCLDVDKHVGHKAKLHLLDYPYASYTTLSFQMGVDLHPLIFPTVNEIPRHFLHEGQTLPHIFLPGLFKGTYGYHGIELLLFKFKNDFEIHGYKVTGDPNVYAGQISIKVNLKFPLFPSDEEQKSFQLLSKIEAVSSSLAPSDFKEQKLFLPSDCYCDDCNFDLNEHKSCKARYHGFGNVAKMGYVHSSFTPIHIIVFSDDSFAVLWLKLKCLSLFKKVNQDFLPPILPNVRSAF